MQKLRLAFPLLLLMAASGVVSAEVRNDFDGDGMPAAVFEKRFLKIPGEFP